MKAFDRLLDRLADWLIERREAREGREALRWAAIDCALDPLGLSYNVGPQRRLAAIDVEAIIEGLKVPPAKAGDGA